MAEIKLTMEQVDTFGMAGSLKRLCDYFHMVEQTGGGEPFDQSVVDEAREAVEWCEEVFSRQGASDG